MFISYVVELLHKSPKVRAKVKRLNIILFCGKMHIFLDEKNEKLLRGLGEGARGLDISDFL